MNLWWGIVLLCFGSVMLALTRLRGKQQPAEAVAKAGESERPAGRH